MPDRLSRLAAVVLIVAISHTARAEGFFGTKGFLHPVADRAHAMIARGERGIQHALHIPALADKAPLPAPAPLVPSADHPAEAAQERSPDWPVDIVVSKLSPASGVGTPVTANGRSFASQSWVAHGDLFSQKILGHEIGFGPFVKYRDEDPVQAMSATDTHAGLGPLLTGLQCGAQLRIGFK